MMEREACAAESSELWDHRKCMLHVTQVYCGLAADAGTPRLFVPNRDTDHE